jgi:hypothetical protein
MNSAFTAPHRPNAPFANPAVDENYSLAGLNLRDPDEIMSAGETPFTINSRMYARNTGDSRVANRTRMGASVLSNPVGETLNVQNVATATGDIPITNTVVFAQPFTPNANGVLGRLDIEIEKVAGATGHVLVQVYTDTGGKPGTLLAESSIYSNTISSSYAYLTTRFIDAPSLVSGTQYWWVAYVQDNGTGPYNLHKTAASGALQVVFTNNVLTSSTPLGYSARYKTYLSTAGGVKGYGLRYPSSNTNNLILFAQLGSVYSTSLTSPTPTAVDSSLTSSAPYVRFTQVNDFSIWVNGVNPARWTDFNTVPTPVNIPGVPAINAPTNVISWQNRLFFMTDVTRVDFSDLSNFTSYTSTNFFYVPTPKSPDHMTGWVVFQDKLTIFTHTTKHVISGSDISTFTRKEAVGTKGAVSQEAICADHNGVYFIADDGNLYMWNGASDTLLSDKMQPELSAVTDKSKIRINVYKNQIRVYYPKTPSTFNNQMLLFDLTLKQWFMDTGHPVIGATYLYLDQQQLVEFSSLVGQVYFGETQYSDLGKAIDWKYWTNYKTYAYRRRNGQTYGGGSAKKRIKRFRPIIRTVNADYTMLVGKDQDFANNPDMREYIVAGGGAKWGAFVWGDGSKYGKVGQVDGLAGMSGRGKHIQYRFERKGVETPVELYGYISIYKIGRQK